MESVIRAILDLWQVLASEPNMGRLLEAVVRTAETSTGAEFGEILLVNDSWTHLEYQFATSQELSVLQSLRDRLGRHIIGVVTRDATRLQIEDPRDGKSRTTRTTFANALITNSLSLPLIVESRAIGALTLFNKHNGFNQDDNEFLGRFLEQVTNAVERELLRVRLAKVENRLNGIFDAIADGILVCDKHGKPILNNRAFRETFFPAGMPNMALPAVLPPLLQHREDTGFQEVVLLKPHARVLSSSFVRTRDKAGEVQETIISLRDVTHGKRQDQRFLQLISILIRRLDEYAAGLRKTRRPAHRVRLQKHMRRILRNLVYLTEIKAGPLRVQKLPTTAQDVLEEFLPRANKIMTRRRMALQEEPPPETEIGLIIDEEVISQALLTVVAFLAGRLKPGSCVGFALKPGEKTVSFLFCSPAQSWKTRPDALFLDWRQCIDWFLAEEKRTFSLDLAFIRHIMDAHKGTFDCTIGPDDVTFALTLPEGAL